MAKDAFNWPSHATQKLDGFKGPVNGYVSSWRATNPYGSSVTKYKFIKTQYIGLSIVGSPYGSNHIAVQLWRRDGVGGNPLTGSGFYVRRNGKFLEKGGVEYFTPYTTFRKLSETYELRVIGRTYRNPQQERDYKMESWAKVSAAGLSEVISWEEFKKFDFKSGKWDIAWYDRVTGKYLGRPNGDPFPSLDALGAALAGLTGNGANASINPGVSGGGSGGGRGGGADSQPVPQPTLPNPIVRIITRMPIGYAGIASSKTRRPSIVQRYLNAKNQPATDEFVFKYVPQGIQYSGLASEWTEIPRADDVPFVDWSKYQLMKVSFSFIVADDRIEAGGATVPDGLLTSVDSQLEKLRMMAQRKVPVVMQNFDDMLTFQLRRSSATNRSSAPNMEFVITDFSITATRRVTDDIAGNPVTPSGISVAQCEITLTEIPVEQVGIVALPAINSVLVPPPRASNSQTPPPLEYVGITPGFTPQDRAQNVVFGT